MQMTPIQSLATLGNKASQLLLCCGVFALGLAGSTVVLAEVRVYDVEVVIFSNHDSGDDGERWPTTVRDDSSSPGFVAEGQFSELPASAYQLNNIAYALRQSRGYSVLLHTAWRQPAYDNRNAIAFPVDAGAGTSANRLAGSIKLVRERYLHLDVDLLLSNSAASPVYELRDKLRIKRSGTVHYFDNPRYGMIATITPYQTPQMQQQLLEQEAMDAAAVDEESAADEEPLPDDDQLTR